MSNVDTGVRTCMRCSFCLCLKDGFCAAVDDVLRPISDTVKALQPAKVWDDMR